jgi:hypothetical protein
MVARRQHPLRCWLICCSLILMLLAACSTNSSVTSSATKGSSPVPPLTAVPGTALGAPGCQPPSPVDAAPSQGLPETQGTATGVQLWALFFAVMPIHPKQELKIVWRMTGVGSFHLSTHGPHGMPAQPTFGPEEHGGSNWNRPGDEWGSGFIFPVAGCWDLHATRGTASGDVWLMVQ